MELLEIPEWLSPERLVALAERMGAREAEALAIVSHTARAEAWGHRPTRASTRARILVGVRVALPGGRVAGAGGEPRGQESVEEIIREALSIARQARPDPKWPGFNPRIGPGSHRPPVYSEETALLGARELLEMLDRQAGIAAEAGARIAEATLARTVAARLYANSHGGPLREDYTSFFYAVEARAEEAGRSATHAESADGARLEPGRLDSATREAAGHARRALDARRGEPGRATLILAPPEAAGLIDTLLAPALSARNIRLGRSPLQGRTGERVLSERLSIIDDPGLPWETGSTRWDDEGHPTRRRTLIDRGVFTAPLYNYYEHRVQASGEPGNGFRHRPWHPTSPGPTNLVLRDHSPAASIDELAPQLEGRVLLVVSTIGSWLSNPVSGQINMTIGLAYELSNGRWLPVKGLTVGGSIYESLGPKYAGSAGPMECHWGVCSPAIALGGVSLA